MEVTLPNAFLVGNVTRNYSRLAANGGVRLTTSVTIGYDTPWRQVQAMLQIAAARTRLVAADPAPRVVQTALQDFYVEYTLVVCVADPKLKLTVLDELHANIQDVFNEYGVQIMSPNYEADPEAKKFVPKEQWFQAPAPIGRRRLAHAARTHVARRAVSAQRGAQRTAAARGMSADSMTVTPAGARSAVATMAAAIAAAGTGRHARGANRRTCSVSRSIGRDSGRSPAITEGRSRHRLGQPIARTASSSSPLTRE